MFSSDYEPIESQVRSKSALHQLWWSTFGQGTFPRIVLVCLPRDHKQVNSCCDITEIMLKWLKTPIKQKSKIPREVIHVFLFF